MKILAINAMKVMTMDMNIVNSKKRMLRKIMKTYKKYSKINME